MPVSTQPEVTIREATPADAAVCGEICYRAFSTISAEHNFPCDIPNQEIAIGLFTMLFSHPGFYLPGDLARIYLEGEETLTTDEIASAFNRNTYAFINFALSCLTRI